MTKTEFVQHVTEALGRIQTTKTDDDLQDAIMDFTDVVERLLSEDIEQDIRRRGRRRAT